MGQHVDRIHQLGAEVVTVGNGTPAMARAFKEDHAVPFPLLVDPSLKVYEAAGLKRSVLAVARPEAAAAVARALLHGHMQGMVAGDNWQQGGTFVVAPGGKVHFRHVNGYLGDEPDELAVMRVLEKLKAA